MNDQCRDVTLKSMLEAMHYYRDDETFRWFQTSYVGADGNIYPSATLRVTMGQARRELGLTK